jgi:hypothetical protein
MTWIILFLVAVVGLLIYMLSNKPEPVNKLAEVGRIMFFCGLLALLFLLAGHVFPALHVGS